MLEKIGQIICEFVAADPSEINESSRLRADLGLNSFDLVNIAVEVENLFGVVIPNKQIALMKTAGDLVAYIQAA